MYLLFPDLLCSTKTLPSRIQNWVSRALSLSVQELQAVLSQSKYVLTLDYAVKMININERKLSGLPVVIQGETGVGKTCLLETLSKLWNLSSVESLSKIRTDISESFCQFLQDFLPTTHDQSAVAKINEVLAALSDLEKETLTLESLEFVLSMSRRKEAGLMRKRGVHMDIVMHRVLMAYRGNPIFSVVNPPARVGVVNKTVTNLFNDVVNSTEVIPIITHSVLLAILSFGSFFLLGSTIGQAAVRHFLWTSTKFVL